MIKSYRKWLHKPTSKNEEGTKYLEEFQLIEGSFNPIEAADVLLSLVAYKIKFHNLQLLNLDGKNDASKEQSEKRITELKEAKSRITQIIMDARNSGTTLEISSNITIKPVSTK